MVAIDNAGNQSEVAHYTIDVDSTFPPHVSEVVAKIQSDSDVVLKWSAVEDAYSGTDFHRIYWRTLKGTLDSQINQDVTRSSTYRDLSRDNGGTLVDVLKYLYTIRAVNKLDNKNVDAVTPQIGFRSSQLLPTAVVDHGR